jgi:CheY-like chemotaxis protein
LINDILDLSKVESGKMELELSEISLRETVEVSVMMLMEKALKKGINIEKEFAWQDNVPIAADQRKLKQILYNLLSNAIKFTPAGGTVSISARRDGDFIEITMADSGIGIRDEDIPKLFQPFTQLESVFTKEYEGTGLGLALTRQLVELHGGRIWVKSTFGTGSRFSFTIPQKHLFNDVPSVNRATNDRSSGKTVLLIEDNPLTLSSIEMALKNKGYHTLRANNGEEGLRIARLNLPDLIVLDLVMPGMNGFDVAKQIQSEDAIAYVPVLVLTAMDLSPADRARLKKKVWHIAEKGGLSTKEFINLVEEVVGKNALD